MSAWIGLEKCNPTCLLIQWFKDCAGRGVIKEGRKLKTVETVMGIWAFNMLFSELGYLLKIPSKKKMWHSSGSPSWEILVRLQFPLVCRTFFPLHWSVGVIIKTPWRKEAVCGSGHCQTRCKSPCKVWYALGVKWFWRITVNFLRCGSSSGFCENVNRHSLLEEMHTEVFNLLFTLKY